MSPAELFNKYGTHFITSAIMGGKINSHYLYSSNQETNFLNISGSVSTEVRAKVVDVNAEIKGSYKIEAASQNIYIENSLDVLGGGDFAMMNDTDIGEMYADWQESLNDRAALIGIKDSGSLWPIWELIDPAKDTRGDYDWEDVNGVTQYGSRAQQLQGYFFTYGVKNYNSLRASVGTTPIVQPESIDSILINDKDAVDGIYEITAGKVNRINFSVSPDNAIGYQKSVRLNEENEYVTIGANNSEIIVSPDITPEKSYFAITVSAGNVSKTVYVKVVKTYSVDFRINLDGVTLESTERYKNLLEGSKISEPELIGIPANKIFCGWYKDDTCTEKFIFGQDPIRSNTTLYAKWEEYKPEIKFVTNIDGYTIDPVYVNYGDVYTPSFTPSYEGYKFDAYCTDAALTSGFNFDKPVTADVTIYLKWSPITYTITFIADGVVVGTASFTVENKNITVPAVPERTGFYGTWESYTLGTESITVNAVYSEKPRYTITYRDGANTIATLTFNEDTMGSITEPTPPTKKGYYSAWESYTLSPVDTIVNVVYTPKPTYTATFYADGNIVDTFTFNEDTIDTVVAPAVPEKTGYTAAWEDYTIIASDVVINAVYTAIPYTITYITNGAIQNNYTDTYTVEDTIVLPKLTDDSIYYEYNYHIGWFYDAECTEEFNEDLTLNPRDITLYAKWDRCMVYASIDSTAWCIESERVIIDWRNEEDTNLLNHTERDTLGTGRYDNIDIRPSTKEIIFIGDPNKVYQNFLMHICFFESNQELKLTFVNFRFVTDAEAAIKVYDDNGVKLEIEFVGFCTIGTACYGAGIINMPENDITITGSGEVKLGAALGTPGSGDGGNGGNGGTAIKAKNLTIDMEGSLLAYGGDGGNGAKGTNANGGDLGETGHTGGSGGSGGFAINTNTLIFKNGTATIIGGNGGAGGRGGDGDTDDSWFDKGGNGGTGGRGGDGAEAVLGIIELDIAENSKAVLNIRGGDSGSGGSGGSGHGRGLNGDPGSNGANPKLAVAIYTSDKAYEVYDTQKTWSNAKAYAESKGGYLVTITSEEEHEIIIKMLEHANGTTYYIGAERAVDGQDVWAWITGEEFDYAPWNEGEPNDTAGIEDCVEIYVSNSKFNDTDESIAKGFIIEYDL